MPIGVISNCLAVAVGGVIGTAAGQKLSEDYKEKMNMAFGACAMAMGISSIVLMENMPAVIIAVLFGTTIGCLLHLGERITALAGRAQVFMSRFLRSRTAVPQEEFDAALLTVIVLFCASGTGIYGSIVEGISGDSTILISKAVLDVFTSLIFACTLGAVVSLIAIPQFVIFLILFALGSVIFPYTTPAMINDFKAVGGVLLLATGFRMIKVRMFPTADMIPAMILAMPFSYIWTQYIAPLL